jgi:hypothetical protein
LGRRVDPSAHVVGGTIGPAEALRFAGFEGGEAKILWFRKLTPNSCVPQVPQPPA